MSTNKTLKRIALVAVASLGFGLVSVAPSNAADLTADSFTTSTGAATASSTTTAGTAATVALIASGLAAGSGDTITVSGSVTSSPLTSSAASVTFADTASATHVNSTFASPTVTSAAAGRTTRYLTASFTPDVVGTYVIKLASNATNDQFVTWTVTADAVGAPTAANSTSFLNLGETTTATSDVTVSVSKDAVSGDQNATIVVTSKNAAGTDVTSTTKLTVTIDGPGVLGINTAANVTSIAKTGRALTGAAGENAIGVFADGAAGVATVSIYSGTTLLATEKVTFYGALASLTATVKKNVTGNGASTSAALEVVGKDAAGVVVPSVGLTITSGTTATIASFTATSSSASEAAAGTASVAITGINGKSGAVVLTIADTATKLVTTTATVTVSSTTAATVTAAFDKASYLPGEKATLTITALDANGLPVSGTSAVASAYAMTSNLSTTSSLPTAATFGLAGTQAVSLFAPITPGAWTVSIELGAISTFATAIQATSVTASSNVTLTVEGQAAVDAANAASDAAAEAIDAANAATDAANLAAEAADAATVAAEEARDAADAATAAVEELATQVATLMAALKAQITTLANTVAKIAKKVKA